MHVKMVLLLLLASLLPMTASTEPDALRFGPYEFHYDDWAVVTWGDTNVLAVSAGDNHDVGQLTIDGTIHSQNGIVWGEERELHVTFEGQYGAMECHKVDGAVWGHFRPAVDLSALPDAPLTHLPGEAACRYIDFQVYHGDPFGYLASVELEPLCEMHLPAGAAAEYQGSSGFYVVANDRCDLPEV